MTILYKQDTKGKIRYVEVSTKGDLLIQESGLLGGNSVVHQKQCTPKNVGKSNETTGADQAVAEAESIITEKLRKGYFRTKQEAIDEVVVRPMLAKVYKEEVKKLKGKLVATQPKLDGIRCIVTYDVMNNNATAMTRTGDDITTIDPILRDIEDVLQFASIPTQVLIIDGELYKHGNTFQDNVKLFKNKPDMSNLLEYHMYDIVDLTGKLTFEERSSNLNSYFVLPPDTLKLVETTYLDDLYDPIVALKLRDLFVASIQDGYEGIMVRTTGSKYKVNGRSSDLLKYKEFKDVALPIEDITPSESRPDQGVVWVKYKGQLQKVGSKVNFDTRRDMLANKSDYIGKTAEIRYFEETDEGKMRFAQFHGLRIDK